jgi:hypothetical protein
MARAILIAGLVFGSVMTANPGVAKAAAFDGSWSVLVITEEGTCDRGYRYAVKVSDGRVAYQGDAAVQLNGTVSPAGAVAVSIGRGDQTAQGTGKLTATAGQGTWRGRGSAGECKGTWQAERT